MSVQARSTLYKGIQMRSRLEADFARFLDRTDRPWRYEPQCFADERGQYLPDFEVGHRSYIEVKPASFPDEQIDPVLDRMAIIWSSQPDARLALVCYEYGVGIHGQVVADSGREWWSVDSLGNQWLWPGMGQFDAIVHALAVAAEKQP